MDNYRDRLGIEFGERSGRPKEMKGGIWLSWIDINNYPGILNHRPQTIFLMVILTIFLD